ncbi:YbeF family protein [Bacillus sp. YC2]|uniref:DUF2651 family protein n=1 Tax=Bacillus sp. YC2 TaxID=2861287 RepID=UPI001CA64D96|nr:DUF2651 family protein [Bacillus sp. YC2]MBY8913387.1 YbeF family protein [Bacillus sp. YC2]
MDELDIAFGILPLAIIVFSIAGTWVWKRIYIMPLVSLAVSLLLMVTVFNSSFWGWVVVYSLMSLVLSYLTMLVLKKKASDMP